MKTEDAKLRIKELIDKYTQLVEEKRLGEYNEELTKKDFILPLFEALGWNVYNNPNKTDSVSAEETISKKRVDYGFRINGIPKFLLEAKAIPVDLNKAKFAEQAINYSWHKGCTWAVLTDFEGIKVFNAEWKSKTVRENLFLNIIWSDYLDRFDKLWWLSKESFEKGLLDKEAELVGKKSKKIPVDKQLLADFTRFREMLSKDITKLNLDKGLTEEELDESVQRILDRLIFIRNCEDRELEARKLMPALREWESVGKKGQLLKQLRAIFNYFNDQYNSKLFQKHLCDTLDISDNVLNEVVYGLYQTKDKTVYYDFSAIEADVLGTIYEQYLGHILRKTAKRAKVTESHARRKEQGIYYTPPYIVDYIVRNTLGEVLKRKRPEEIEKIRVLDPACGSGSFLIKSFDLLNEYWKEKDKDYAQAQLDTTGQGTTFTRKAKILHNNIFGVDLDKQAVEIAQLNLLLKIAEKGHRLPLLQQNIKCGNSLIDDEGIAGDKAFYWEEEFKEIMDEGGFDVVVGNPPYIQLSMEPAISQVWKEYFITRFKSSMGRLNTFGFFIKLGIDLLKENGRLGYIIPNTILTQEYYEQLREMILNSCKIEHIVHFSDLPFKDAVVENVIIVLRKSKSAKGRLSNRIKIIGVNERLDFVEQKQILQSYFIQNYKKGFNIFLDGNTIQLKKKIEQDTKPLGEFLEVNQAIALKHDRAKYLSEKKIDSTYKKVIDGRHINRYSLKWDGHYLKYDVKAIHSCKREDIFLSTEKLFFRRVGDKLIATLDNQKFYALNTLVVMNKKQYINLGIQYFLALFNSKLMNYYYQNFLKSTKRVFSEIQARQVKNLPIKQIPESQQEIIIKLVDKMLSLNKRLNEFGDKKTDERARIEEEIKKTDKEIDELVYKLYDITEEEKKIIEGC